MGAVLDFLKSAGKRKKSPSFQIHNNKKKLEKAQAEAEAKNNKEMV